MPRRDHRRTGYAWRRRKDHNQDPARMADLDRRELTNLEECRRVWEEHADPLALTVGLKMAEDLGTCPTWLVDGLMLALWAENAAMLPRLAGLRLGPLWAAKVREMNDVQRTAALLAVRNRPGAPDQREQNAKATAGDLAADHAGADPAGASSVRDSYHRVREGLAEAGRYWQTQPHVLHRLHRALERLPERHRARLTGET